jgi:hypothetical protein
VDISSKELVAAYASMIATARPAIAAAFYEKLNRSCPDSVAWFVGPTDWLHLPINPIAY